MNKYNGKINGGMLAGILAAIAFGGGFVFFILLDQTVLQSGQVPEEYKYDLSEYAKIDPAKILYQQVGIAIDTGFENSVAIDVDFAGNIYAAGDKSVVVFSSERVKNKEISLDREPTCLKATELNLSQLMMLYIGQGDHIVKYSLYEDTKEVWKSPQEGALLTGIAIGKDGIFAADAVNKVIWQFDMQGNLIKSIGDKDPDRNIPGFVIPSPYFDIEFASDGLLRVVNSGRHLIEAYTVDGHREWVWGEAGIRLEAFSGCCNPTAIAICPDEGFITTEKGLVRIKKYNEDGEFECVVAGPDELGWKEPLRVCDTPEQCSTKAFDVAVDGMGKVYVLDQSKNRVLVFERKD